MRLATPEEVARWWRETVAPLHTPGVEVAGILIFDASGNLVGHVVASSGSRHAVAVPVQSGMRQAILLEADAVTLVHTHPGKDSTPSTSDMQQALSLRTGCRTLGLTLRDSIIIPESGHPFSFASNGWLMEAEIIRARGAGERAGEALAQVLDWLELGMPGVSVAVLEAATNQNISPEQFLANILTEELRRRFGAVS